MAYDCIRPGKVWLDTKGKRIQAHGGSMFYPTRRMDRPHIIKNEKIGKYVLWLKYCDRMHFAVLTADSLLGPYTVLGNPHVDDDSSASFNSQASAAFKIAGTDKIILMADRWVPEYVMTKERYDVIYRAIASNYNKNIKATVQEKIEMMKSPMMGSADTSIADYVWLPVDWDGETPVIRWRDAWKLKIENKQK